jgi:hypothetical protein
MGSIATSGPAQMSSDIVPPKSTDWNSLLSIVSSLERRLKNMTPLAIALVQLIVQYGIPGAIQIINAINKPTISQADIDALAAIKPPESYFNIPKPA